MKKRYKFGWCLTAIVVVLWANNTSVFTNLEQENVVLLAHRGAAQTFSKVDLMNDSCTATRIFEPKHDYLENTLESMEYAFKKGAEIVEFDIHMTTDNKLAVFHNWTLDCHTNGSGVTHEQTMEYLRTLDIGYGYTADNGETFPFRGRYIGKMPEISEVFAQFPDRKFLINLKRSDSKEVGLLISKIRKLPDKQQHNLMVYGGDDGVRTALNHELPAMPFMNKSRLMECYKDYVLLGWSGVIPESCRNNILYVPKNIKSYIWGWPNKFVKRMSSVNTQVFVMDAYTGQGFSTGVPTEDAKKLISAGYKGGIWTDDIDEY